MEFTRRFLLELPPFYESLAYLDRFSSTVNRGGLCPDEESYV